MRRLGALCLILSLAGSAVAADPPPAAPSPPEEPNWFRRWVLGERNIKATPVPAQPGPAAAAGRPTVPVMPSRDSVARQLAEEQRLYLERLQAISKIKRIADERGDEDLMRKAEQLEAQAEDLFRQRTARLPNPTDLRDDQAALERGADARPATAQRPMDRRPSTRGGNR